MPDPAQLRSVESRLRAVEERTGVQIVAAAIQRADVYHGLRWRAFALGAAVAGLALAPAGALCPGWIPFPAVFWAVAAVLGAGLLCALAATVSPAVSRLLLEPFRAEAEVRQQAAVLFLERQLFATRGRTAVLLLASGFERLAVVLADTGIRDRASAEEWRSVEEAATRGLRAGGEVAGLTAGLDALERLLAGRGFAPPGGAANELPDRPLTGPAVP